MGLMRVAARSIWIRESLVVLRTAVVAALTCVSAIEALADASAPDNPGCAKSHQLQFCAQRISIGTVGLPRDPVAVSVDALLQITNNGQLPVRLFYFWHREFSMFPDQGRQVSGKPKVVGLGGGCNSLALEVCARGADTNTVILAPQQTLRVTARFGSTIAKKNMGDLPIAKSADLAGTLGLIDGEGRAFEIPISLPTQVLNNELR